MELLFCNYRTAQRVLGRVFWELLFGDFRVAQGVQSSQILAPKRLLARIWPKTVRSQGFQKQILIASWKVSNDVHLAPKRRLAGIWPKAVRSQ